MYQCLWETNVRPSAIPRVDHFVSAPTTVDAHLLTLPSTTTSHNYHNVCQSTSSLCQIIRHRQPYIEKPRLWLFTPKLAFCRLLIVYVSQRWQCVERQRQAALCSSKNILSISQVYKIDEKACDSHAIAIDSLVGDVCYGSGGVPHGLNLAATTALDHNNFVISSFILIKLHIIHR